MQTIGFLSEPATTAETQTMFDEDIAELGYVGPGQGWLAVHEASMVLDEDPHTARILAGQAVEIGRTFKVPELEMVGLGLEGVALVSEGDVAAGMRRLDEATATALSGDAEIIGCVAWACCYLIAACEQVRDYNRAGEWCRRVSDFCQREHVHPELH